MTSLSPQNEQLLRDLVATGRYRSEDEAIAAALRVLGSDEVPPAAGDAEQSSHNLSLDHWLQTFREWSRRHRRGNRYVDDSRESIYGDRGL